MKDTDVNIRISPDEMAAYLEVFEPQEGAADYGQYELENAIKNQNIVFGINRDRLKSIVENRSYNHSYEIARGEEKKDGVDGYYEYLFNTNFNSRPEVNENGTVNYKNLHLIEIVEEGEVIVVAHPPTESKDGMTVTGKPIVARRGRPVVPLRGRGFVFDSDAQQYKAAVAGKVEKINEKVFITEIYEISGDVDMKTGNIEFKGDVVIRGNVTAGMMVTATGSITVNGTVEAAILRAGKDIIVKGGFIGAYKGLIETEKDLIVKFMQYGTVRTGGAIRTDAIISCHVTCYDHIYMDGKHANIIGGYVYAAGGVDVYTLGCSNEIETKVVVGIEKMHLQQMFDLREEISKLTQMVKRIETTILQIDALKVKPDANVNDLNQKRASLLRTKIKSQSDLNIAQLELEKLEDLQERSEDPRVVAIRDVYPGVCVTIGTELAQVKDSMETVEFRVHNGKIGIFSMKNSGEIIR